MSKINNKHICLIILLLIIGNSAIADVSITKNDITIGKHVIPVDDDITDVVLIAHEHLLLIPLDKWDSQYLNFFNDSMIEKDISYVVFDNSTYIQLCGIYSYDLTVYDTHPDVLVIPMTKITKPDVNISVPKDSGITVIPLLPETNEVSAFDNNTPRVLDISNIVRENNFMTKDGLTSGEYPNPMLYKVSNIPRYINEIHLTINPLGGIHLYLNKDREKEKIKKTSIKTFEAKETSETDWDWPMFHHDLRHTGYSPSTAPDMNQKLWSYETGRNINSQAAIANGRVFIGSFDKKIYCLNESTRELIWNRSFGDAIRSSPAVADGMVFVGTSAFYSGIPTEQKFYALNETNGDKIWVYDPQEDVTVYSPTVADGRVFVGFVFNRGYPNYDSVIFAFDEITGEELWNYSIGYFIIDSPAVAEDMIFFAGGRTNTVFALDTATGDVIWIHTIGSAWYILPSPVLSDGMLFIGTDVYGFFALNMMNGNLIWNRRFTEDGEYDCVRSTAAVHNEKLFVRSQTGYLYALNKYNGNTLWKSQLSGQWMYNPPAVADGKVFTGGANSVYTLNETNGGLVEYGTGFDVCSPPAIADGILFIGSCGGTLHAFGHYQPPGLPDLTLTQDDISFSSEFPTEGETVTITATIHNIGEGDADNVLVRFYDGDSNTGTQINEDKMIATIPAGGNGTAFVGWTATLGSHEIYVVVDPEDTISESNETNNQASREIEVISPTFKVLVVATYYQDESLSDIEQYESRLNASLKNTTEYYMEQSYDHDYIGFGEIIYIKLPEESNKYDDGLDDEFYYYSPPKKYIYHLWDILSNKGIDLDGYDAILAYQTDKAVKANNKKHYRALAYLNLKSVPVAAVNTEVESGVFAHELGHSLYNFADFYGMAYFLCDFHGLCRGDIQIGKNLGVGLMGDAKIERPIISFNKVFASWLGYYPINPEDLPKTIILTSLENMNYGDDVVKISGIDDPGIDKSYDFILEARTDMGPNGVMIYEDHHGWLGSWLEYLEPQKEGYVFPTLSSDVLFYRHPVTTLEFQYLGEDTNTEKYKAEINCSFNPNSFKNMEGIILRRSSIFSATSNSTYAPPSPLFEPLNISNLWIMDFKTNLEGDFTLIFVLDDNRPIQVQSIEVVNSANQTCSINTSPYKKINPGQIFKLYSENCIVFEKGEENWTDIKLNLTYNQLSGEGEMVEANITKDAVIRFFPPYTQEKPMKDYTLEILFILGFLIIFLLAFIVKYVKNKKQLFTIVSILAIILVILLLLFWLYIITVPKVYAEPSDTNREIEVQYPAPINTIQADIDLHAYTDTGLHIGMNYETGIYENQIPSAIASGDRSYEEWIFIPNNLNVRFVIDSHDVQQYLDEINSSETLITNYSLQIMEYGENPEVEVIDDNVIITDRTVSKPVIGTIGPGEQDAVVPEWIKEYAVGKLEAIQTDNKHSQKEIDEAIKHITNSLETTMWIDQLHLDAKHGHKVFDEEKKAVEYLMKITNGKGNHPDPEIVDDAQEVIDDLIKADEELAKIAIEDAKDTPVEDPKKQQKVDHEIEKAEEELAKAYEKLDKGEPDKAIDHFKKAWEHAQNAIKHAENGDNENAITASNLTLSQDDIPFSPEEPAE